ncbi:MAG: OmpA family protein [Bacteroidales bacterium]|nr:OmpA family protein [Bacteroidales bacterium]
MQLIKKLTILVFISLVVSATAFGQRKNFAKAADEAYEDQKYVLAIERYKKAQGKIKNNKAEKDRVSYHLAECYRLTGNPKAAKAQYKRLHKIGYAKKEPGIMLHYANILKSEGFYEKALEFYNLYAEAMPDDPRGPAGVESVAMIEEWLEYPSKYEVEYIKKINSRQSDFCPTYASDNFNELIFTSTREGSTGKKTDEWTDMNFSDLFTTRIDRKEEWGEPVLLDNSEEGVNTEANEGAGVMNSRYNALYFTRCPNEEKKINGCQIYTSRRTGRIWSKPEMVKLSNDSSDAFGHPAISENEMIIYFTSDREGGFGGNDIWVAFRDTKEDDFSRPFNLGPLINTPGDEMFPYLRSDTVLYFASDGHPGMGGLDIFLTTIDEEGNWSQPENIKPPMNSEFNDFGIVFHPDEEKGFFSSDRRGRKGMEDIFYFIVPPLEFTLTGVVTDDRTLQFVMDANISLVGSDGTSVTTRTTEEGVYNFGKTQVMPNTTYEVVASKANYFNSSATITTVGHEKGKDFLQDFLLKPIPEEPIVLPEILYDLAKWNLKPQYEDSLQGLIKTLNENPRLIIELASHTDARDSYERNDILSQKRAQSVVDYLILRGIDAERLKAKGYGERNPRKFLKDFTQDGYSFKKGDVLTEEYIAALPSVEVQEVAHQLNRRTDFSVLRKDYIPRSVISEDPGEVSILINPDDDVISYRTQDKTGLFIIPVILNGYNEEFIYEERATAQVSLEKALQFLNNGIIGKEDFEGDPAQILANNSIRNNSVFNIAELRIGSKTINDISFTVVHRQINPITLGRKVMQRIGQFRINENAKQITFRYKED